MQTAKPSQSTQPNAAALVRALIALSLGWLLLPVLVPVAADGGPDRVLIEAELRVGEQPPAPVAEVATIKASLRALNARSRAGTQQTPAASSPLATPLLTSRASELAPPRTFESTRGQARRAVRCHWPLPRSSCQPEDDPTARIASRR